MEQLNYIAMSYNVWWLGDGQRRLLRTFNDPPVVDVLETVARDLLLVGRTSTIGIAHRINVCVRMEPACTTMGVPLQIL